MAEATLQLRYQNGDSPIQNYIITEPLNRGKFGEVYKAVNKMTGKIVALKLIIRNPQLELHGIKKCINSKHSNLLLVFDVIDVNRDSRGETWVLMEFVDGQSLKQLMQQHPDGLSPHLAYQWYLEMRSAVACLHAQGIIHGDIKPDNIFLDQESGCTKIGDYGLARSAGDVLGTYGVLGSPGGYVKYGYGYCLAPESWNWKRKGRFTPASDYYAVGCVFYWLLTGRPPFLGNTLEETRELHRDQAPDLELVPRKYRSIVADALQKKPEKRRLRVRHSSWRAMKNAACKVSSVVTVQTLTAPARLLPRAISHLPMLLFQPFFFGAQCASARAIALLGLLAFGITGWFALTSADVAEWYARLAWYYEDYLGEWHEKIGWRKLLLFPSLLLFVGVPSLLLVSVIFYKIQRYVRLSEQIALTCTGLSLFVLGVAMASIHIAPGTPATALPSTTETIIPAPVIRGFAYSETVLGVVRIRDGALRAFSAPRDAFGVHVVPQPREVLKVFREDGKTIYEWTASSSLRLTSLWDKPIRIALVFVVSLWICAKTRFLVVVKQSGLTEQAWGPIINQYPLSVVLGSIVLLTAGLMLGTIFPRYAEYGMPRVGLPCGTYDAVSEEKLPLFIADRGTSVCVCLRRDVLDSIPRIGAKIRPVGNGSFRIVAPSLGTQVDKSDWQYGADVTVITPTQYARGWIDSSNFWFLGEVYTVPRQEFQLTPDSEDPRLIIRDVIKELKRVKQRVPKNAPNGHGR